MEVISRVCEADRQYRDPGRNLSYGTAGYRTKGDLLSRCCFRVGLVVAFRARSVGRCGAMITASHNHHADNGVKIVEPDGSMLVHDWEVFSEMIVNSKDLAKTLQEIGNVQISDKLADIN